MSLDIFSSNIDDAVNYAARVSAPALPTTFSDNLNEAWNRGYLTSQSISGSTRRAVAIGELVDDAVAKTGDRSLGQLITEGGGFDTDTFNQRVAQHKSDRPELDLKPITDEAVSARADEIGVQQLAVSADFDRQERTFGGSVGRFVGTTAAAISDPVNMIAFPLAAPEALGVLGTALAWGAIGAGSQVAIEAMNSTAMERIQPGYGASGAPVANVIEAAAGGALLGGGLKGMAAAWTRVKTGSWPRSVRDAGNVVESEAQIASTNRFPGPEGEAFHRTALQQAIDDMVAGRPPFEQTPLPEGGILAAYDAKLAPIMEARARASAAGESAIAFERDAARLPPTMERLSEVQLTEFRDVAVQARQEADAAREAIAGERAAVTTDRAGLTERTAGLEAPRQEADGLRADLARLDQRIAETRPATDPETQARLDAIDADLKGQIGADARARLEAERAQITDTLAKTGPEDARLIASLSAERKGLARALARSEKALAKAEAQIAKQSERVNAREQAIPGREQTAAQREASRVDAATNGLRRSVARLAQEGYGVRLPAEDAQAFASRILAANDNDVEAALRGVTEDLVSRAVELRRLQPPELPGIGKPVPAAEQSARKQYYTEEMRKGITAVAREVGYEMPREEAAALAARLAGMSEQDAMAVLDELLLRPRTLLETLPGTAKAKAPAVSDITRGPQLFREGTQQPGFAKWFSGSKVVDADNRPMPVFHGTTIQLDKDFAQFDKTKRGAATDAPSAKEAFFFSEDVNLAKSYAEPTNAYEDFAPLRILNAATFGAYEKMNEGILNLFGKSAKSEGKVVTAYLKAENPLVIDYAGKDYREESFFNAINRAKADGHDAVLFKNAVDPGFAEDIGNAPANIWAVFEPDQIKIAKFQKAGEAAPPALVERAVSPESAKALREELAPAKIEEMRTDPEMPDTVARDLDKLMLERPDLEVPMGVTVDAEGRTVPSTRKVEDVVAEADDRLAAAKEIEACVGPYPTEAASVGQ